MITKIIKTDYPEDLWEKVEIVLNNFGTQSWHNEIDRVRIAILKLAHGDIIELQKITDAACVDYRDILAWAEYPNDMKSFDFKDTEKQRLTRAEDKRQFSEWLLKYK